MNRPVAYKGNEPYVFVSYCHRDDTRIWPVIEGLQTRGVRVWYDEGIEWGSLRACTVLVMDHLDYPARVLKKYEEKYDAVKKKNPYTGVIEAEKKIWKDVYSVSMGLLLE